MSDDLDANTAANIANGKSRFMATVDYWLQVEADGKSGKDIAEIDPNNRAALIKAYQLRESASQILYAILPGLHPDVMVQTEPHRRAGMALMAFRKLGHCRRSEALAQRMTEALPESMKDVVIDKKTVDSWEAGSKHMPEELLPVLQKALDLGEEDFTFIRQSIHLSRNAPHLPQAEAPQGMQDKKEGGALLQHWREHARLNRVRFAKKLGIRRKHLEDMEEGREVIGDGKHGSPDLVMLITGFFRQFGWFDDRTMLKFLSAVQTSNAELRKSRYPMRKAKTQLGATQPPDQQRPQDKDTARGPESEGPGV